MDQTNAWPRRIARVWSLASLVFLGLMLFGEMLMPDAPMPTSNEWLGLALFPGGVALGLLVAWRREAIGGLITVISLILFYLWAGALQGDGPRGPYFFLIAAPGLLFLLSAWLNRDPERSEGT